MISCKCGVNVEESSGVCPNCGGELEVTIAPEKKLDPGNEHKDGRLFIPFHRTHDMVNESTEKRRSAQRIRYRKNKRRSTDSIG